MSSQSEKNINSPTNISDQIRSTWYLAATKPKQELRAVENLANQNIKAFCPQIKVEKISRNKKQLLNEVLFKGYIFIQISLDDPLWHKVRSTRGIRDWIRFSGSIASIPTELILELKTNESSEKRIIFNKMNEGDKVRILSGPFEGLEAVFQKDDGDIRAILLLKFLGQSNRLTIEKSQISVD